MNQQTKNLIKYNSQVRSRLNASNVPHGDFYWMLAIHTATERLGQPPTSSDLGREMQLTSIPHITRLAEHGYATIEKVPCKTGEVKIFTLTQDGLDALESIVIGGRKEAV